MPMRLPESWYNEYRGLRNDGAVRTEQHLVYVSRIQADAVLAEREAMVSRILAACGDAPIPAWLLRAAQATAALPVAPVQAPAAALATPTGLLSHAG